MDTHIDNNTLRLGELSVTFHRTLRIPDDGRRHALPPSLGAFPLRRVDDYLDTVPEEWRGRGGVFLPMYQREAMWISFSGPHHKPRALKIAVGKVCALTGERWTEELHGRSRTRRAKQDYIVTPPQPWLDGICAGHGTIKQFVAMPLGQGYTVEGQITGEEKFGGVQIKLFEPKPGRFPDLPPVRCETGGVFGAAGAPAGFGGMVAGAAAPCAPAPQAAGGMRRASVRKGAQMGLAAGGRMKQKIYPDPHGVDTWDPDHTGRVFVHLCNTEMFTQITGETPPPSPVTVDAYNAHGLPWYDLYDEAMPALDTTPKLVGVKSVDELDGTQHDGKSAQPSVVKKLFMKAGAIVRDGGW